MNKTPCPSCDQPMNAAALVCPHCGARRAGAPKEPGLGGMNLSKDEVNAILAVGGEHAAPSQGIFATLVFPHPTTHGTARAIEVACAIIAAPLIFCAVLSVGMMRGRRGRRRADTTTGELVPVLAAAGLGGLGLWSLLGFLSLPTGAKAALLTVSIVAICIRGIIRARASSTRDRDLHRLAAPEPTKPAARPSKPQLPAARLERPSKPQPAASGPIVITPAPAASTSTEAPRATAPSDGPLPDEPSLLK